MRSIIFATAIVLSNSYPALAICDHVPRASAVAERIGRETSILADSTTVACDAFADDQAPGQCTIICFSALRVTDGQRPGVLASLTAISGLRLRESGHLRKFRHISFMEKGVAEKKQYFRISAAKASELQMSIHSGKLSALEFIKAVDQEFLLVDLPSKKPALPPPVPSTKTTPKPKVSTPKANPG